MRRTHAVWTPPGRRSEIERAPARAGPRLELVVPASNRIIARTIEIASPRELMTVHDRAPGQE